MDFFSTHVAPRAIELAAETLRSGWISEGRRVQEFEGALTAQLGLSRPVAVNSGTSALHLALNLAGVGTGDEVILPAQTFVATGLVILMQGAIPVFADIDPETGNISPASIAEKITERTRAVMPVHWGGYPCDLDEINDLAAAHGLAVIEDAAHALGARYKGRTVGSISRFTAFSFQAIKHLTTGDGGALCCADEQDRQQAIVRRWFGIDRANSKPSNLGERDYDITDVGFKYHMNDLAAAVGLGNLTDFGDRLARRARLGRAYREALREVPGLRLLRDDPANTHAYWLFTVLVENRDGFIRKLKERGVPTSVVHRRIDRNTIFGGLRIELTNQAEFERLQISIPAHDQLTDDDAALVINSIVTGW